MEVKKLKKLLKEAFEAGRDYQYDINPYSGKLKEDSKALTFTKWYNNNQSICKKCYNLNNSDADICYNCLIKIQELP